MNIFTLKNIQKVLNTSNEYMYDWFNNFDINTYTKNLNEKNYEYWDEKGKEKALNLFKVASKRVPAYKDFLKKNSINSNKINSHKDFLKVPLIDKNSYISQYDIKDLCIDGDLSNKSIISMSSGTSGNAYLWPRSMFHDLEGAFQHEVMLERLFRISSKKTLAINLFSMGAYVAGTYTFLCLNYLSQKGYDITAIHPGLNTSDMFKILDKTILNYDQVIIFGYPPFVKDTLDSIGKDFFKKTNVELNFVFASEFFTENFREYMHDFNPKQVDEYQNSTNIYGAADATLFGYETNVTNLFRKLLSQSKNIPTDLKDFSEFPTIVEYNPAIRYFESLENNLILTVMSGIPLVRYDLHDVGGILTPNEMKENIESLDANSIKKNKISISNLPYVYINGRKNGDISYYGIIMPRSYFRAALEQSALHDKLSGRFTVEVSDNSKNSPELFLHIEEKDSHKLTANEKRDLVGVVNNYLIKNISEFRFLLDKIGEKAKCKIKIYKKGQGDLFKTKIKQKWTSQNS